MTTAQERYDAGATIAELKIDFTARQLLSTTIDYPDLHNIISSGNLHGSY